MPLYTWECDTCSSITEVRHAIEQYDLPPEEGCSKCGERSLHKIIIRPSTCKGFILKEGGAGGFHDQEYSRFRSIK